MNTASQLRKSAIISYIGIFINILIGVLYTPWLVRQLGNSNYGVYTVANTIITFFMVDLGIGNSISRFLSKYRAENNEKQAEVFLSTVYKIYLYISAAIFLALIIFYFFLGQFYAKMTLTELLRLRHVYLIVSFFGVVMFPFNTFNGILTAYEQFVPLKLAALMQRLLTVILVIIFISHGGGLYELVWITSLTGLLVIAYKYSVIRRHVPLHVAWQLYDKKTAKNVLGFSIWVSISSIASQCILNLPLLILGSVSGTTAVTLFNLSTTIYSYVYTFSDAVNGLFMPKVSRICQQENRTELLNQLAVKVGRIQMYVVGLIVSGFCILGREFVYLWVGDEYMTIYWIIIILILPTLVLLTQEIDNTALYVENKVKYLTYTQTACAGTAVVLSYLLDPGLGAEGAGISVCAALVVQIIMMNYYYHKYLAIDVFAFFRQCQGRIIPVILLAVLAWYPLNIMIHGGGWLYFCLRALLYCVIYAAGMWLLSFNAFEKGQILSLFHRSRI